jgi:hypothetical protein
MLERLVEERIREAIARGEFDNLPGAGRPVDLTLYFQLPEETRVAFTLLKDHDIVPPEVQIMQEIGKLRERLAGCDDKEHPRLSKLLRQKQMELSIMLERRNR